MEIQWHLESLSFKEQVAFIKLKNQPLESQILKYGIEKKQPFTLKELKSEFPQQDKNIDQVIESFVQKGYLARNKRQYESQIPFLEERLAARLLERYDLCVAPILKEIKKELPLLQEKMIAILGTEDSVEELTAFFLSVILNKKKQEQPQVLAYEAGGELATALQHLACIFHEVMAPRYRLIQSGHFESLQPTIYQFFLGNETETYEETNELYQLVGDVSSEYSVTQFGNQLVQRHTGGKARGDIFAKFLEINDWLDTNGQLKNVRFCQETAYLEVVQIFQRKIFPLLVESHHGKFPQFAYDVLYDTYCKQQAIKKSSYQVCLLRK